MTVMRTKHQYEQTYVLAVTPERAWRAFTDQREREAWSWDRTHQFDARPGGRVRYEYTVEARNGLLDHADADGCAGASSVDPLVFGPLS